MIQLLQQPGSIAFTRNPMLYRFRSLAADGSMYAAIGVRSEVRITGYLVIPNDETLTLTWTQPDGSSNSITFTAKTTPSASNPLEIPATLSGFISYSEYYDAIGAKMKAHPEIGPYFKFYTVSRSGDGQSFWAEALEQSNDWIVEWDISGITSGSFAVVNDTSIVATNMPDNYEVLLEVFLQRSYSAGNYERIATIGAPPDANGETAFDLSEIINAEVRNSLADPPIPAYSNTDPLRADNVRNYYVRYREDYDGLDPVAWTLGSTNKALCGGISQNLFATVDFFSTLTVDNAFLTWQPDKKTVSPLQKEYLHWYNYTGVTRSVMLEVKTYGTTGLIATSYEHNVGVPTGIKTLETASIPTGLDVLGLDTSTVLKYTVQVIDYSDYNEDATKTYLSQVRTYYVDRRYQQEPRQLMYLNSFCVVETITCTGYFTKGLEVSSDEAEKILGPGYANTATQLYNFNEDWNNTFIYRTGFLRKSDIDALQELLIYKQAYELLEDAYITLKIADGRFQIAETRQDLSALRITAQPSLKPISYSKVMPIIDVGRWLLSDDSGYWITTADEAFGLTQ